MKNIKNKTDMNNKDFSYPTLEPFNFLGLPEQNYQKSKIVIFPVPYSSTTYWKSGTKEGPQAIIEASRHLELYDIETDRAALPEDIFTLEFLEPSKNSPEETVCRIKKVMDKILKDGKTPLMLGGEHSITLGAAQSFKEKFSDLSVLQLDAHADLRDEFEGTKYHHACVMKRIRDLIIPITQVGVRSISKEESDYIKENKVKNIFYSPKIPLNDIVSSLSENVYITFDLDVLDPAIMPSTGTPEPDGLDWEGVTNLIKEVAEKKRIIGADVVELDPIPGMAAPDFLAAKLTYKIINSILLSQERYLLKPLLSANGKYSKKRVLSRVK